MANRKTAVGMAVGSAFVAGMAMTPAANAAENPFALQSLDRGYMVADAGMQGKCGAGKCGGMKSGEAKCGMSMLDTNKDGKVSRQEFMKAHMEMFASKDTNKDGVLSEDEMKMGMEGKCGGMKGAAPAAPATPAKPMEGKCGGMK